MINSNRTRRMLIVFLASLGVTCHYFCSEPQAKTDEANKELTNEELVAKGSYLVNTGGCTDCHSPKVMTPMGPLPDSTRFLSGHPGGGLPPITYDATKPGNWILFAPDLTAAVGPWGMSFAANLTPDSVTGIGAWSKEVFIKTLRTGKHLGQDGGRPILPPMPWPSLARMSDEDLSAIYAYLQSVPPVKNQVPAPVPPGEVMK